MMDIVEPPPLTANRVPEGLCAVIWLGAMAAGILVGLLSGWLQQFYAPVGVFPLAAGVVSGLVVGGIWRCGGLASRKAIVGSAFLAGLTTTAGMHYGVYLAAKHNYAVQLQDLETAKRNIAQSVQLDGGIIQTAPEPDFPALGDYLRRQWDAGRLLGEHRVRGGGLAAWWAGDALLVLTGAVLAAAALARFVPRVERTHPHQGVA